MNKTIFLLFLSSFLSFLSNASHNLDTSYDLEDAKLESGTQKRASLLPNPNEIQQMFEISQPVNRLAAFKRWIEDHPDKINHLLVRKVIQTNRLYKADAIDVQESLLHRAVEIGCVELTKLLIENGADCNRMDSNGYLPLHKAALGMSLEVLKELIKFTPKVDAISSKGSALFLACLSGQKLYAQELLNAGANVDLRDSAGATPLLAAVFANQIHLVELLLEHNADLNAVNGEGESALFLAATKDHCAMVKFLLDKGINPPSPRTPGLSLTFAAAKSGNIRIAKMLFTSEHINSRHQGKTPLILAVEHGDIDLIKLCLDLGATITREDILVIKRKIENLKSKNKNDITALFTPYFVETQKEYERQTAAKSEEMLRNSEIKRKQIEEQRGVNAVLGKTFFATAQARELGLGAKLDKQIPITLTFAAKKSMVITISFVDKGKSCERVLNLQAQTGLDGCINNFLFLTEKYMVTGSSGFIGLPTHAKDKKTNKAKRISNSVVFQNKIVVTQLSLEKFKLSGSMNIANANNTVTGKEFEWIIDSQQTLPSTPSAHASPSNEKKQSDIESNIAVAVAPAPKNFPDVSEIPGHYNVTLQGRFWGNALISSTGEIEIVFEEQRNSVTIPHRLLVEPFMHEERFAGFTPLSLNDDGGKKFFKGITSFEGSKLTKKGKGIALAFQDELSLLERRNNENANVTFSTMTTKGHMVLTKCTTAIPKLFDEPQHDNAFAPVEELNQNVAFNDNAPVDFQLFAHQDYQREKKKMHEAVAEPVAKNTKKKKIAKQHHDSSYEHLWLKTKNLGYSELQQDHFERDREKFLKNKLFESTESPFTEDVARKKAQIVERPSHEIHVPYRLISDSNYNECPLVTDSIVGSTWFGQGYAVDNENNFKLLKNKKIVLGMKNWQELPRIADNAAWGSLMSSTLGANNFFLGKNVHISYHKQLHDGKQFQYINVSHHYRFQIESDGSQLLLYQILPKTSKKIVYVLRNNTQPPFSKLAVNKMTNAARKFIAYQQDWREDLDDLTECVQLYQAGELLQTSLKKKPLLLPLKDGQYAFFTASSNDDGLLKIKETCIPALWNLHLINRSTASVSVHFQNQYGEVKTLTKIFSVDDLNSLLPEV